MYGPRTEFFTRPASARDQRVLIDLSEPRELIPQVPGGFAFANDSVNIRRTK
jgi:hypothetical protein